MSTGELMFEAMRHRVIDDLRCEYNQLWMQSIDGETQRERDWYCAKCEGYEEAIASIAMGVLQMPLTLKELKEHKVVWLEVDEESEAIPVLLNGISDKQAYFIAPPGVHVNAELCQYGKYWRAWAYEPTPGETERAWDDGNAD